MIPSAEPIYVGETQHKLSDKPVLGDFVTLLGGTFYRIRNYDAMEPFFMSLASSTDHWLFIASTGGLTAGRVSAEQAAFPYYSVDKVTENSENTGSKALLLVKRDGRTYLWEPFTDGARSAYRVERNLYKNVAGTAVVFEETNADLGLTYRYAWRASDRFGLVRSAWVCNNGGEPCLIALLDGLQNILPANVSVATQNQFSVLLDAYKRSELDAETGIGIFALSSTLTDLAEPSESLLATTAFQLGLDVGDYLLSTAQLDRFRMGQGVATETDVRGRRGAYFVLATLDLAPGAERDWHIVVDTHQDSAAIARNAMLLRGDRAAAKREVEADIALSEANLTRLVASADGLQHSAEPLATAHHFANVMFNVMRGGIFADGYWIDAADFKEFVGIRNRALAREHAALFDNLSARIRQAELLERAEADGADGLVRLAYAYLPLTFSRRHGDPSRPWNRFAINIRKPDGARRLDYEGNWRDIFQNWEALAYSYPEYIESMISTFLCATTVDGYNPYRITRQGIDWEVPEPGNPWANIGYWSDHQIIYLQKLMEVSEAFHPGRLRKFMNRPAFSYANVPYRIRPYERLLKDPFSTIEFDWALEKRIEERVREIGTDAKLVERADGRVLHVTLAEKLLSLLLAKLSNFVPEGGVWMTTQRPEWNDANNALVGKGLSVVTLGYLRRYIVYLEALFADEPATHLLSAEVRRHIADMTDILAQFQPLLHGAFSDEQRRAMMDALGRSGSALRWGFYTNGLSGAQAELATSDALAFLTLARQHVEHALRANRRSDGLYHTYNILHLSDGRASIGRLAEMLEGQVSILSSGMLSCGESLALLRSLRNSSLYRADQHSYILYPDRDLPGFLAKNNLPEERVRGIGLLRGLIDAGDTSLITRDANGMHHFSGRLRNAHDATRVLDALARRPAFAEAVKADADKVLALFEDTFRHSEFTGRSGTFFAYEGLGSIYWHMVSKLLLAVEETARRAANDAERSDLAAWYADIRAGLGFHKSPDVYGAFPTDPYSHTPKGQGAKQPGMTGLVKEEILTRWAELGLRVDGGRLIFETHLLDRAELLAADSAFDYIDVDGQARRVDVPPDALAYTYCQTPVILREGAQARVQVHFADGAVRHIDGAVLDADLSRHLFLRDGLIRRLTVEIPPA